MMRKYYLLIALNKEYNEILRFTECLRLDSVRSCSLVIGSIGR